MVAKMAYSALPDISVCIVTWNNEKVIDECLVSLFLNSKETSFEVILVDNNSGDGTVELVQKRHPSVRVVSSKVNLGFARANNLALSQACGSYILFLNPDTVIHSQVLAYAKSKMDADPKLGVLGCRLILSDGATQLTCASDFPTAWNTFCEGLFLHRLVSILPIFPFFSSRSLEHWDHLTQKEVESISGAFMFCRKCVLDEIGGFDPGFFMYGEDIDLCARIRRAGYKVWYDPTHVVTHYGGASSSGQPSAFSTIWQFKSNYRFISRNINKSAARRYQLAVLLVSGIRTVTFIGLYPLLLLSGFPAGRLVANSYSMFSHAAKHVIEK
jgi:GT2 family glycosyltransferase